MTAISAVVALDGEAAQRAAEALRAEGVEVRLVVAATAPADAALDAMTGREAAALWGALASVDVLVLGVGRHSLSAQLAETCDRFGVRIVAVCAREADRRFAAAYGLFSCDAEGIVDAVCAPSAAAPASTNELPRRGRVIVVWGPAGAPGRSTIAIEVACELARDGRRVALVDADAHAPSIAMMTGLADEGPGFAAACRQSERGGLSAVELERISMPLGDVGVLTGINRPGRWPELSASRVSAALDQCRTWVEDTVVDVAAPLERDEEIVSDVDGPRRNAATIAALAAADVVIAVVAADPIGISRFVRAHAELRATIGTTPVHVLVNKARSTTLGLDARGQVRRTLEHYTGVGTAWFIPSDAKAVDAATLAAQPIGHVAARSAFSGAVRRFVGEALEPPVPLARRAAGAKRAAPSGRRARRTHTSGAAGTE